MIRVMVLGDSGVGKTSILSTYTKGHFKENQAATIGIDYRNKTINRGDVIIKLQIWDTAGEERYHSITNISVRDADAIVIAYDISQGASFKAISNRWIDMIKNSCRKNVSVVLIGNKNDLNTQREVTFEQGQVLAKEIGCGFYETSAKGQNNIDSAFGYLIDTVLSKIDEGTYQPVTQGIKLERPEDDDQSGFGCNSDALRCSCI